MFSRKFAPDLGWWHHAHGGKGSQKKEVPNVSEQQNRDTLERYRQAFFERQDIDAIADLVHDDYVEEYPQSGERIRGKDNARTVYENYPGLPTLIDYGYRISGDLAVIEMILDYDGHRMNVCEIVEYEDGKIKRARAYFGEPFEAPQWRAQWVERM
jgi:limonene-1,2-epoxide hydrolase